MGRSGRRLSYANVVSTLALFIALGGASYAAVELPAGSVGQRQLRPGAVTREALAFPLGIARLPVQRPVGLGKGPCDGGPLAPGEPAPPCIPPSPGPRPGLAISLHVRGYARILLERSASPA